MECNRCGEQQSWETLQDALVEGRANELFVCLKCEDEPRCVVCDETTDLRQADNYLACRGCGSVTWQIHGAARLQKEGRS
jgi:DNA-directed RNA polymerase subunit RPC12/RpoP